MLRTPYKELLEKDGSSHIFIEQLQCIGKNIDACNRALENNWAFYSERVRLQESGEIPLSAWEDRDDELYNRWLDIAIDMPELDRSHEKNSLRLQRIYSSTMNPDYRASLNGYDTNNSYFTIGNYHSLANHPEKNLFIYWHDNYKILKDE